MRAFLLLFSSLEGRRLTGQAADFGFSNLPEYAGWRTFGMCALTSQISSSSSLSPYSGICPRASVCVPSCLIRILPPAKPPEEEEEPNPQILLYLGGGECDFRRSKDGRRPSTEWYEALGRPCSCVLCTTTYGKGTDRPNAGTKREAMNHRISILSTNPCEIPPRTINDACHMCLIAALGPLCIGRAV